MSNLDILDGITERIRETFEVKSAARDAAINQSRTLTQYCANAIRAVHRHEWETAQTRLQAAHQEADALRAQVADFPDLRRGGCYVCDGAR
jgi:translin